MIGTTTEPLTWDFLESIGIKCPLLKSIDQWLITAAADAIPVRMIGPDAPNLWIWHLPPISMWRLSLVASILSLNSEQASSTLARDFPYRTFCRTPPFARFPDEREIESFATKRASQLKECWMMTSRIWLRARFHRVADWHTTLDQWTRRLRTDGDQPIRALMGLRAQQKLPAELPPPDLAR